MFRWIGYVLFSPFWAAGLVYGPYGLGRLFEFRSWLGSDALDPAVGAGADAVLPKLFTARALVAAGVLAMLVRFVLDPQRFRVSFDKALDDVATNGFMVLLLGPPAVLAVVLLLLVVAEDRLATAAAALVPIGVGLLTFLVITVTFPSPFPRVTEPVRDVIRSLTGDSFHMPLVRTSVAELNPVVLVVLVWVMFFVLGAAYLAHRNGLCRTGALPLLPPLVTVLVVWGTVWLKLDLDFPGFRGLDGFAYTATVYATPVAATVLALAEIVLLWVREDVTLRDPLA